MDEHADPEPIGRGVDEAGAGPDTDDREGSTDEADEEPDPVGGSDRPEDDSPKRTRFDRVRTSTAGVMMTGIAIGLQEALELPTQKTAFVIQASGEPDGPPGPIDLHFDPDDPTKTVAVIRPPVAEGDSSPPD